MNQHDAEAQLVTAAFAAMRARHRHGERSVEYAVALAEMNHARRRLDDWGRDRG